jgi:hypothetical protein
MIGAAGLCEGASAVADLLDDARSGRRAARLVERGTELVEEATDDRKAIHDRRTSAYMCASFRQSWRALR